MLHLNKRSSLSYWDLARSPGKEDSADLVDTCWRYLEERSTHEFRAPSPSPALERRIRSEVAAAHLQVEIRPKVNVEKRLADAEATIDRLLAFVPTRAHGLEEKRLDDVSRFVLDRAQALFAQAKRSMVQVIEESDVDTTACHRLTLLVDIDPSDDPSGFAASTAAMHLELANYVSPDELHAIRLVVEPLG